MEQFIQKYNEKVKGVLNGFDRLVLRGTLRVLAVTAGMMEFLYQISVLLKDFGAYAERTTARLKEASLEAARHLDRPIKYLQSSQTPKETIAREIAAKDNITEGLIAILTCVEPCMSYEIYRNREKKELVLMPRERKCLHLYHYWIDPNFGFMNARIQTWFPFTIQVCLNGREWLARQMDLRGMRYERHENCFTWLEDNDKSQALMEEMLRLSWPSVLNAIAYRLNPAHKEIFNKFPIDYYWSVHQSEWATDIMFKSQEALEKIYPTLVCGAISSFSSHDVMRFLGRKKLYGTFMGEVVSYYKKRPEGVRVKHCVKTNSIKVYDKHGSVLRVESTINDPTDFKVFRPREGDPNGPKGWRKMRKGIADMYRRAQVSQASNEKYLDALASLSTDLPLRELIEPVCHRVRWKRHPVRGLRPWTEEDRSLLQAINRGEFALNGFRNRNIVAQLYPQIATSQEKRRRASAVTRKFRMLRAHRIIRKVPGTHRYVLSTKGREIVTAILELQNVSLEQLNRVAA